MGWSYAAPAVVDAAVGAAMTPRRRRRAGRAGPARRVTILAVLAVLLTGCVLGPSRTPNFVTDSGGVGPASSVAPSSAMPVGPGGPGRSAAPAQWSTCPEPLDPPATGSRPFTVECADVSVPVTYGSVRSGRFSLGIARARAPGVAVGAPVLVVALGEPGENGARSIAAVAASLPTAITDRYSIVSMDPRGSGESAALACVSERTAERLLALPADPGPPPAAAAVAELTRTLTYDCGDEAGPSLSAFTTVAAADDLDTVRAAVGVPAWSFLGRGFGATLGAVYADRYPGRVTAMVLDAPRDPGQAADVAAQTTAAAAEKAFDAFAAGCRTLPGGCPLGADPRAAVAAAVSTLDRDSLGPGAQGDPSGGTVLRALLAGMGRPAQWTELATAVADAGRGRTAALSEMVRRAAGGDVAPDRLGARILFRCNDSPVRLAGVRLTTAAAAARGAAPLFGPFTVSQLGVCGGWPAPDVATPGLLSGAGAPRLLIVAAVDDPLAPLSEVTTLATHLSSAVLVRWQSAQHGSYPVSACVTGLVDDYLLRQQLPAPDTLCPT